jgi:hypothetical protein
LRATYGNESWYKDLHGNYTHFLLPYSETELREKGKAYAFGTPFRYDPMPTLRTVKAPQLWILGEDDFEAPSAETSRRIKTLMAEGRPITLAVSSCRTRHDRIRNHAGWYPGFNEVLGRLFRDDARFRAQRPTVRSLRIEHDYEAQD